MHMSKTYRISIDKGRCVLCRYCEVKCSIAVTGDFDPDVSVIKEIKPQDGPNEIECNPPEACWGRPQCVGACDERALKFREV